MSKKDTLIRLLTQAILELPEKTEAEVIALLAKQVGPLIDDSEALAGVREELKVCLGLNDQAEAVLDAVMEKQAQGHDALVFTPVIDRTWTQLARAREVRGRQKPGLS